MRKDSHLNFGRSNSERKTFNLVIAGKRKVLPQWMPLESIVGEDSSQIRMVVEPHTVQIVYLPFIPASHS